MTSRIIVGPTQMSSLVVNGELSVNGTLTGNAFQNFPSSIASGVIVIPFSK